MPVMPKGEPIRQNAYVSAGEIKIGDFLTLNSAGQVAVATATQALVGVANAYVAAANLPVQVWDHPDQMFMVPTSAGDPDAQTEFNLNYNIVANTTTGPEGNHRLDSASGATTATLPLKALMQMPVLGAAIGSAGNLVVCVINNHQLKGGTGSAGI